MFKELKALSKEKKAYEAKVKAAGKSAVKSAVADFLKAHPDVKRIRWKQYTPYFNDGEPCVFRVQDAHVELVGYPENGGDNDDGFLSTYELEDHPQIEKTLGEFDGLLSQMSDALRLAFGDHTQITASATEIEVVEYDHD